MLASAGICAKLILIMLILGWCILGPDNNSALPAPVDLTISEACYTELLIEATTVTRNKGVMYLPGLDSFSYGNI